MPPKKPSAERIKEIKAAKAGVWVPKEPELNNEGGFIRIRKGLIDHFRAGYITPNDFAVYFALHNHANWETGICNTTAASLAAMWGEWRVKDKQDAVLNAMERLRERGYIDYPLGTGKHGIYPVLINKAQPTTGPLKGWRLRLLVGEPGSSDFRNPWYQYDSLTPFHEVYGVENADGLHKWWVDVQAGMLRQLNTPEGSVTPDVTPDVRGDAWRDVGGDVTPVITVDDTPEVTTVAAPLQDVLRLTKSIQQYKNSLKLANKQAGEVAASSLDEERIEFIDESRATTSFNLDDEEDELPAEAEPSQGMSLEEWLSRSNS